MILVTGANGFVGRAVVRSLKDYGYAVRGAVRQRDLAVCNAFDQNLSYAEVVAVGDIGPYTDWEPLLDGVDTVIHLAGRVHIMNDSASDSLSEYCRVNLAGTERLARMAIQAGVRRLIFVSSIKVNGEITQFNPFAAKDMPSPQDPYSLSKWEAEKALMKISRQTDLEVVIIRSPLVYGPHVKGNFLRLMEWIDRRLPLPLASVKNSRSFVGVENLADLLAHCVVHPKAVGETFLVADGENLSTPDLIRRIAKAMGRSVRLIPFPIVLMRIFAKYFGKGDNVKRLFGSLEVDFDKTRKLLNWSPKVSVDEGLANTVRWYFDEYKGNKGENAR